MYLSRGRGMGGGAGGGGMFRTVGRMAARARVATGKTTNTTTPESLSSSSCVSPTAASGEKQSNQLLMSASTHGPGGSVPISANSGLPPNWPGFAASSCCDESDWVSVDGVEDEKPLVFPDDFVVGPVPSIDEVQNAVSALEQVVDYSKLVKDKYSCNEEKDIADPIPSPTDLMCQVSSLGSGSESDWMEPSMHLYGPNRVYDAFHLLQTDPCIKNMVISLSSDKAVWDAVLNNEVVQELRESYFTAEDKKLEILDENSDDSKKEVNFVQWIFDSTKAKVLELMGKITNIVNELFRPPPPEAETTTGSTAVAEDPFQEKLRTSFLLSVMVLLIVVVSRAS
ncbi:hypothetical protein SLA2020_139950 [Shorea laevis]